MSSETHTASSDGNAIQGGDHEAAVGYPVNWNWFFQSDLSSSSDATTKLLDRDYPSNNATVTTNNDIACNESSNRTKGMKNSKSNNAVTTLDRLRRNNCFSEDVVLFLLLLLVFSICLGISIYFSIETAYVPPLTFKVVSLEVASMTISNNPSSDIQKYMSADVNLTLGLTEKDQEVLILIQPLLVSIMYDDEFLSSTKIDPQDHKSIELDMSIMASHLSVETVDSIVTNLAVNHSLVFKIHIKGGYCILKSEGRLRCDYGVAITCDGVKVNFLLESNSTRGSLINGPCSCKSIVD
ncbi:uncharacterized protein LOC141587417 [Silene latifolia]|uniref:uncharacterized protein LOC141587417 n=1 Tax=Silene latifolia TaxID=37657 RepID=UPI003D785DCE